MFGALRCNSTDSFPDGTPTGTMSSGLLGRFVTEAIGRPTEEIGESKEGK
jgi:hypothetical protein